MAIKKTGISIDLIIHPGETISDILDERGITQNELAIRTGLTPAFINNVISGKKNISANFAMKLEYALGIPKTFWLNLQADYDAEMLEYEEMRTITEEEKQVHTKISDVIKCLRNEAFIPTRQSIDKSIIALRNLFGVSSLCNLKDLVSSGTFRMASTSTIDPYVLGAWLSICLLKGAQEEPEITNVFDISAITSLINELKSIMQECKGDPQEALTVVMAKHGIDFSILKNFRGAPVHGYISRKREGIYQMVLTIRGAYADIFWFSLFHELGHIVNGDVKAKKNKFIDVGTEKDEAERKADKFARDALLEPISYKIFVNQNDFTIEAIQEYANSQNVPPYIVIGRLQKEEHIGYSWYNTYKIKYMWIE